MYGYAKSKTDDASPDRRPACRTDYALAWGAI